MGSSVQGGTGKDQTTSTPNLPGASELMHTSWLRGAVGHHRTWRRSAGPGLRLCIADAPPSEADASGFSVPVSLSEWKGFMSIISQYNWREKEAANILGSELSLGKKLPWKFSVGYMLPMSL